MAFLRKAKIEYPGPLNVRRTSSSTPLFFRPPANQTNSPLTFLAWLAKFTWIKIVLCLVQAGMSEDINLSNTLFTPTKQVLLNWV